MNTGIQQFKEDFFTGLLNLTKKTGIKMLYAYLIYYGAAMIIGVLFMLIAFLGSMDMTYFTDALMNGASEEASLIMAEQIIEMLNTPEFVVSFAVLILIMMILAAWQYYIAFLVSNDGVKEGGKSFKELLGASFSAGWFKLLGVMLVVNILITAMFVGALFSATLSGILAFLLFIVVMIFSMRLILVLPAYVIGNYDFGSSFAYSFYHIGWTRALKILGILIVAMILMFIAALVIAGISFVFSLIPFIGVIIQMAINIIFNGIMLAITVNALTGLFYRYVDLGENKTTASDAQVEPSV